MANFHIHIDAWTYDQEYKNFILEEMKFITTDFCGHPEGREGFEPPNHLTLKIDESKNYKELFEKLRSYSASNNSLKGYLEGEYISSDHSIDFKPFDSAQKIPFKAVNQKLNPGSFKEAEIHVTMEKDKSDKELQNNLLEMGFCGAYTLKTDGSTAVVFTIQGSKETISNILPLTTEYLENAGGAVNCTIKEERIIDYWLSNNNLRLAPVINDIKFFTN